MTTNELNKLRRGTNLWVEYKHDQWYVYHNSLVIYASPLSAEIAIFIKGFKAALTHVNGVEFNEA